MSRLAVCILGELALAQPQQIGAATYISGNVLYQRCTASEGDSLYFQSQSFCQAYVLGAVDVFDMNAGLGSKIKECIPAGVSSGQLKDVVIKYLREKPENRHLPASEIIFVALGESFPCTPDANPK